MAASSPSEAAALTSTETASQFEGLTMQIDENNQNQAKPDESEESDEEQSMFKKMLNPMLSDLELKVSTSTQLFDSSLEVDRKKRVKRLLLAQVPEILHTGGEQLDSVLDKIAQLVFYTEVEGTNEVQLQDHLHLQEMNPVSKASLVAYSLKAYLTSLPEADLRRVSSKITSDCQLWLSRLFRFENSSVMYHDDDREGLVRICRLALYHSYPKYATDGFDALYSRPPVIYLSSAARPGLGHYLCLQLGLPLSCICTVPCNTVFGASSKLDVAMLEKLIQDDLAAAKTPVLLLAFAGTPMVGHVDNIHRLQEICKTNSIWLHVEGNHLATLTLFSVPSEVSSAKSGDSITVNPGTWLGVPGLPCVTLFKASDATLTHAAGLNTFNSALKLGCLPYWMCLLTIGHEGIVKRLTHACDLAKHLYDRLDSITTIRQISRDKKEAANKKQYKSLLELLSKALNALLMFEMASPTVVFRYAEDEAGPGAIVAPYAAKQEESQERSDDSIYYDAPEYLAKGTTVEDMDQFFKSLLSNLSVLNASTLQRKRFQSIAQSQPNLRLVHLQNWAGLGAVSYIPDMLLGKAELGENDQVSINNLNAEVVHQLKAKDTAFSMGHTESGSVCVKFGLITEDTDVDELVQLVQSIGREVEESSRFLESMSELIRKGIEEANQELEKENKEKLVHEGVLRQIPMVSSMLNWLSPVREEVKGRSFNLTSGKISSTVDTYRMHVQIKEETNSAMASAHAARSPRSSTSSLQLDPLGGSADVKDQGSTTAGQVKAQLISQTPPSTPIPQPIPVVGPGINTRAKPAANNTGAQSAEISASQTAC